jgi:hypothetical protein
VYESKQLSDGDTIVASRVQANSTVRVINKAAQQQAFSQLTIKILLFINFFNGQVFDIRIEPRKTLYDLEYEICERTWVLDGF